MIVASQLCDHAGGGEILASEVVCQIVGLRIAELIQPVGAQAARRRRARRGGTGALAGGDAGEPARSEPQAPPSAISVVIADDQLLRTGFRVIVEAEPDINVVGEAAAT